MGRVTTGISARQSTAFLDGLRGIAALTILVFHSVLFAGTDGAIERDAPVLYHLARFGYLGVPVFIVLSGYVLMAPAARTPTCTLPGGTWRFLARRARRIVPPYWAALAVTLLLIAAYPAMQSAGGTRWDSKLPIDLGSVVSHVLLVQDFDAASTFRINGPMWSVALEWHIYWLMPFVLLPLWRRARPWVAVTAALAAVVLATETGWTGPLPHPWLVALFVFGMAAAATVERSQRDVPWAPGAAIALVLLLLVLPAGAELSPMLPEILTGAVTAAMIVWTARRPQVRFRGLLESALAARLGLMSYSVYLIHSPILAAVNLATLPWGLPTFAQWLVVLGLGGGVALVAAWVFHVAIERHFMTSWQRSRQGDAELQSGGMVADGVVR